MRTFLSEPFLTTYGLGPSLDGYRDRTRDRETASAEYAECLNLDIRRAVAFGGCILSPTCVTSLGRNLGRPRRRPCPKY